MEKNQFFLPLNLPDIRDEILPEYIQELMYYRVNEPAEHQAFMAFADKTPPALATQIFKQLGLTPCLRKMTLFTTPVIYLAFDRVARRFNAWRERYFRAIDS